MELFQNAKTVRLRSVKDRYLVAENDQETVSQDRDGSSNKSVWTVEIGGEENFVRFKSCYGTYLAATNTIFVPWVAGKMVVKQFLPEPTDMSITDWEPLRDGFQVRLRTRSGSLLRPNGGLPPWRNTITHDIPRSRLEEKVLWSIDVAEPLPAPTQSLSEIMTFQRSVSTASKLKFLKAPTFRKSSSISAGCKGSKVLVKQVTTLEDLL